MRAKPQSVIEAEALPCPFCGAKAGKPCRVLKTGHEVWWPHADRLRIADESREVREEEP